MWIPSNLRTAGFAYDEEDYQVYVAYDDNGEACHWPDDGFGYEDEEHGVDYNTYAADDDIPKEHEEELW